MQQCRRAALQRLGSRRWQSTKGEVGAAKSETVVAAEAEAARALEEAKLKMDNGMFLLPWERSAFGDRTAPLKWWQKAYWVGFAVVVTYWAGERCYDKATTGKWHGDAVLRPSAAKAKPRPTLLKSRVNQALSGASFVENEDDPFEGLSPQEIEALVAKEAPAGDAFDGLSPDEIRDYVQRETWERQGVPPPQPPAEAAT